MIPIPADVKILFKADSADARAEIDLLKKEIGYLREGFKRTQEAADGGGTALERFRRETTAVTHVFVRSINDFGGALNQFDRRFLGFHERVDAFTGAIHRLPPEITAVGDAFDVLAPTAERVAAIFDNLNTSLVSSQREVNALDVVTQQILQDLQDLEGLAHVRAVIADRTDVQNANLINQGIADAVRSFRDYNDVLLEAGVNFRNIDDISEDVTASIRTQASAFDALRQSVDGVAASQARLQGQQLGSGVFDQFSARTPGTDFGTSFADNLRPLQAQIGQELASQAIRTAGELRRIEEDRVENLEDLEREYSEQIVAINERKREQLAEVEQAIEAERVRRLQSIQGAFEDAKNAEVEARQEAADKILEIEQKAAADHERLRERFNDRILDLEQRRDARIQELTDGLVERERDRQAEILAITEQAAEARAAAEQQYADRVQDINNQLVESIRAIQSGLQEEIESLESGFVERQADRADEIVRITQEAADARAAANETFSETMEGIYTDLVTAWDALEEGFLERQESRAEERIAIEQRAADARVAANEDYAESVARISTDLVDEVRRIESEIVDVQQQHAEDRLAIEQESIESRAEANADYARRVEEIETDRGRQLDEQARRLQEIQATAASRRLDAERDLASDIQGIQNRLVDEVVGIQQGLNDTLNDLRDDALDAERDRQQSLVDLHEETQQKLEDLERSRTQTIEDLNQKFEEDRADARERAIRQIADINRDPDLSEEERAERREKVERELTRRLLDLGRDHNRRVNDLERQQNRQREDLARQAAAKAVEIAERAQAELAGIADQETAARAQAQEGITTAESAAGVAFQEAQANYVPALSAHEQALSEHTAALNQINQDAATATAEAEAARTEILQESIDAVASAGMTLRDTLMAVTAAERERLTALDTSTGERIAGLQADRSAAETRTGLSFDEALANYTPAVDLNTQALQALTEALGQAESDRLSALGAVDAAGAADRLTTQTAQQALETGAGVSIEEARANLVPALSSAAQATRTLNETMRELDTSFRETIAEIQETGLVDRQATDAAIQEAVSNAIAQQTLLETQAGTTFADASLAFQPGLSDISQAGVDRDSAITGIDEGETADIDAVNAQSLVDRLETDAAITETRDAYIKARDTEIFKHNTEILQLNIAEAADIKAVRATLSKNLESIDDKLDTELAEIRDTKAVFDARIGELITAINAEANQDVTALKADTAAMRSSLEAIAEEARNNQWKSALLKISNVGITIAGTAIGTAVGAPQVGFVVGQAVGNLVEQGGNELFHYPQTDAIARRLARSETLRRSRSASSFLPDANQIRNAKDVSREIVAGVTEGLNIGNRTDGGFGSASQQASFPEEINATLVLEWPDGATIELRDQMIRLQNQDRSL